MQALCLCYALSGMCYVPTCIGASDGCYGFILAQVVVVAGGGGGVVVVDLVKMIKEQYMRCKERSEQRKRE